MKFRILTLLVIGGMVMLTGCFHRGDDKTLPTETSVVIVGMRKSQKYGECPGSDRDAISMTTILSKYTSNVKILLNNSASVSAVKAALNEAVKSKLCIFYYSGHGGSKPFKDTLLDPTEDDGKDEYLCLNDGYLRDNDIWNIISRSQGKVFLMFDCCHSKTMYREPAIYMKSAQLAKANGDSNINMLCWSGCPDDTYSYGDEGGGKFTNAIKKWFNKDLTYNKLWSKIEKDYELREYQTPMKTQLGTGFDCEVFR